jgi:hypothetical protein
MPPYPRLVLLAGTPVVVLAFIGAVYFQIYSSARATRDGWMLTKDVAAGSQLSSDNVQRIRVGSQGTPFLLYEGDPIRDRQLTSHAMKASHLLGPDDVMQTPVVLVPLTFAAAPELHGGDTVDVYVARQGRSVLIGRGLTVESSTSVWVPAADEPDWVALEADKAQLVAVRSSGAGVPPTDSITMQQALDALSGVANGSRAR